MVAERRNFSTGNPWEQSVGFSRAVRTGNVVYTAGTVASDETGKIHGDNCYEQCCYIFRKLEGVLQQAGSALSDVVKVVCFLTDLGDAADFTRAHSEFLGEVRPVATCVQTGGLFGEGSKVEIELIAIVPESGG